MLIPFGLQENTNSVSIPYEERNFQLSKNRARIFIPLRGLRGMALPLA
jgi:hypothetical protein